MILMLVVTVMGHALCLSIPHVQAITIHESLA
jgi:hypothetical protein